MSRYAYCSKQNLLPHLVCVPFNSNVANEYINEIHETANDSERVCMHFVRECNLSVVTILGQ